MEHLIIIFCIYLVLSFPSSQGFKESFTDHLSAGFQWFTVDAMAYPLVTATQDCCMYLELELTFLTGGKNHLIPLA